MPWLDKHKVSERMTVKWGEDDFVVVWQWVQCTCSNTVNVPAASTAVTAYHRLLSSNRATVKQQVRCVSVCGQAADESLCKFSLSFLCHLHTRVSLCVTKLIDWAPLGRLLLAKHTVARCCLSEVCPLSASKWTAGQCWFTSATAKSQQLPSTTLCAL